MNEPASTSRLGQYLLARRALVTPQQAGIPGGTNRRVAGLRREEVAMLAGISADYYLRLPPHHRRRRLRCACGRAGRRVVSCQHAISTLGGRQDVRRLQGNTATVHHPVVGTLRLHREKLPVGGLLLVVYYADAGSDSADKLRLLATLERGDRPAETETSASLDQHADA